MTRRTRDEVQQLFDTYYAAEAREASWEQDHASCWIVRTRNPDLGTTTHAGPFTDVVEAINWAHAHDASLARTPLETGDWEVQVWPVIPSSVENSTI